MFSGFQMVLYAKFYSYENAPVICHRRFWITKPNKPTKEINILLKRNALWKLGAIKTQNTDLPIVGKLGIWSYSLFTLKTAVTFTIGDILAFTWSDHSFLVIFTKLWLVT